MEKNLWNVCNKGVIRRKANCPSGYRCRTRHPQGWVSLSPGLSQKSGGRVYRKFKIRAGLSTERSWHGWIKWSLEKREPGENDALIAGIMFRLLWSKCLNIEEKGSVLAAASFPGKIQPKARPAGRGHKQGAGNLLYLREFNVTVTFVIHA